MRCTPIRLTPVRCTPNSYTPCEIHAYKVYSIGLDLGSMSPIDMHLLGANLMLSDFGDISFWEKVPYGGREREEGLLGIRSLNFRPEYGWGNLGAVHSSVGVARQP